MKKRIVITGATGLIGRKLTNILINRGEEVIVFTRDAEKAALIFPKAYRCVGWNYRNPDEWQNLIDGSDAVVHLAGVNLFSKRWNESFKRAILESRKLSTKNIVRAIRLSINKPEVLISSSGAGYYGNGGETILYENSPAGGDFLADVCKIWESEAQKAEDYGTRNVRIRTGIVLSPEDGALKQMLLPYKLFVGGPLGNGKQWFPWLHIDDIVGIYLFALDNTSLKGPVNAASVKIVRMREFAKVLGRVLKRPSLFPVPQTVLKMIVGEAAEAVTGSQRIDVKKLMDSGYSFEYESLDDALENLLK